MRFKIFVTIIVYLMSRKWHSTWGIPGTEVRGDTEQERKVNMTKGWEWYAAETCPNIARIRDD